MNGGVFFYILEVSSKDLHASNKDFLHKYKFLDMNLFLIEASCKGFPFQLEAASQDFLSTDASSKDFLHTQRLLGMISFMNRGFE